MPIISKSLKQITARPLSVARREQLRKLASLPDSEIDFSDAPEITAEDVARERVRLVGRGGHRPGSGRKSSGNRPVTLRLRPRTIQRLRTRARKEGRTLSEVAEQVLASV